MLMAKKELDPQLGRVPYMYRKLRQRLKGLIVPNANPRFAALALNSFSGTRFGGQILQLSKPLASSLRCLEPPSILSLEFPICDFSRFRK